MRPVLVWILTVSFVGGGVVICIVGAGILKNAKASADWPVAQGSVVSSQVVRRRSSGRDGVSVTYKAEVLYEYTVDGGKLLSNRVSFGQYSSSNPGRARRIANRYPKGKKAQVYYDPSDPEVAVLEPGARWSAYVPLGAGGVSVLAGMAVFCAYVIVVRRRSRRPIQSETFASDLE